MNWMQSMQEKDQEIHLVHKTRRIGQMTIFITEYCMEQEKLELEKHNRKHKLKPVLDIHFNNMGDISTDMEKFADEYHKYHEQLNQFFMKTFKHLVLINFELKAIYNYMNY